MEIFAVSGRSAGRCCPAFVVLLVSFVCSLAPLQALAKPLRVNGASEIKRSAEVGEWRGIGVGFNDAVRALTIYNGELIAAGNFTQSAGTTLNGIARWDGTAWMPLGSGVQGGPVLALASYNGELIVGGSFTAAGGVPAQNIAKWNGAIWSSLGSGVDDSVWSIASVVCH